MAQARKRSRNASETKASIVHEATILFATRGYERTSLEAIASAIGISAPALYYHFDSKDEILFATLETTLVQLNQMSADGVAEAGSSPVAPFRAQPHRMIFWGLLFFLPAQPVILSLARRLPWMVGR